MSLLTVSVLAVLGAGAWWWVTWPERTARTLVEHMAAGRIEEARQITSGLALPLHAQWSHSNLREKARTPMDLASGQQIFEITESVVNTAPGEKTTLACTFVVERGSVIRFKKTATVIDLSGRVKLRREGEWTHRQGT